MNLLSNVKYISLLLAGLFFIGCSEEKTSVADYEVIPMPLKIKKIDQPSFILKDGVTVYYPSGNSKMQKNASFLASYVEEQTGIKLNIQEGNGKEKGIVLSLGLSDDNPEAYQLKVDKKQVQIKASSEAGIFYGIQTLRKSINVVNDMNVELPAVEIFDKPEFGYRGMMLDVARHFFNVDEIKTYIDIMALHNVNKFHWHLSEDQGWRIEIKKYPKLTEVGSKRKETIVGHTNDQFDGKPYGGYYTQEEAKEIVSYAAERNITVIPEIDLPGHMQAALAAYPELGCTGGPYEVWTRWGVSDNVLCAGNDKTIQFIKDVLAELIEIFPSKYIHIGGDECPKGQWAKCPKCQARIKALGIKGDEKHSKEQRLQTYVMHEAEQFLNSHGRQIIGWDEILEGGLTPNATVMSWRGEDGGIQAAQQRHNAIMSPMSFLYFNLYQSQDYENEPDAWGGYIPVKAVYDYNPIPKKMAAEDKKYIIGVQANLWTEYISDFKVAEYMVLPRAAALSEIQWCHLEKRDYEYFLKRLCRLMDIYRINQWNYATHILDANLQIKSNFKTKKVEVTTNTFDNAPVFYTLDGTEPDTTSMKINGTLEIDKTSTLKTVAIRSDKKSHMTTEKITFNKATMKPITMLQPINEQYKFKGADVLIDGLMGNNTFTSGRWIAFHKNDMEAVIDLKEQQEISFLSLSVFIECPSWVFDTRGIIISVSDDNKTFKEVASESYPVMKESIMNKVFTHELKFDPVKARYVKVKALSEQSLPAWHGGKGKPGFLFVDEIILK